jgi:hypothetical protein
MEKSNYQIECGRCGMTKTEPLTEEEAKGLSDRISPVYRSCSRCGKTTGWIEARTAIAPAEGKGI